MEDMIFILCILEKEFQNIDLIIVFILSFVCIQKKKKNDNNIILPMSCANVCI